MDSSQDARQAARRTQDAPQPPDLGERGEPSLPRREHGVARVVQPLHLAPPVAVVHGALPSRPAAAGHRLTNDGWRGRASARRDLCVPSSARALRAGDGMKLCACVRAQVPRPEEFKRGEGGVRLPVVETVGYARGRLYKGPAGRWLACRACVHRLPVHAVTNRHVDAFRHRHETTVYRKQPWAKLLVAWNPDTVYFPCEWICRVLRLATCQNRKYG
jgi:hypothetical protein